MSDKEQVRSAAIDATHREALEKFSVEGMDGSSVVRAARFGFDRGAEYGAKAKASEIESQLNTLDEVFISFQMGDYTICNRGADAIAHRWGVCPRDSKLFMFTAPTLLEAISKLKEITDGK